MKRTILLTIIVWVTGCQNNQALPTAAVTPTAPATVPAAAEEKSDWSVYDPNPEHVWNRVFRQLYRRTASDGTEYGAGEDLLET